MFGREFGWWGVWQEVNEAMKLNCNVKTAAAVVVLPAVFQQLVDPVWRHRQVVYDRLGPALP